MVGARPADCVAHGRLAETAHTVWTTRTPVRHQTQRTGVPIDRTPNIAAPSVVRTQRTDVAVGGRHCATAAADDKQRGRA